mgnify:CR=1 FL=1
MAIETEITWSIDSVKRDISDGFITQAFWTMTGVAKEDGVGIATATQTGPPVVFGVRPDPMIAYNNVTQANVISWVQAGVGTTDIALYTNSLNRQLEVLYNPPAPTSATGVPW